jgi:hypothetical protein
MGQPRRGSLSADEKAIIDWYAVDQGTYHITPVSDPDQPRDVWYDLRFNKKPLGWEKIGPYYKTLRKAVSAAQRHYAAMTR